MGFGANDEVVSDRSVAAPAARPPTFTRLRFGEGDEPVVSTLDDLGESIKSGLARVPSNVVGTPAAVGQALATLHRWVQEKQGMPAEEYERHFGGPKPEAFEPYTPGGLRKGAMAAVTPEAAQYEPQTLPGKIARGATELGMETLATGPGVVGRGVRAVEALLPFVAGGGGEAAGEVAKGTKYEPWVRGLTPLAIGTGGAAVLPRRPGAEAVRSYAGDVTPAQIDMAEDLVRQGQAAGIPLSRAQALSAVTEGASNLPDLLRIVEGSGRLRGYFAPTAQGIETTGRQEIAALGPQTLEPSTIGPQVGRAAEAEIGAERAAINTMTRPAYQQAEAANLTPAQQAQLAADPIYQRTLDEVRRDIELNPTIAGRPDENVAVADLVQRRLGELEEARVTPGQQSTSRLAATNIGQSQQAAIEAAEQATGSRPATPTQPAVVGDYERARQMQATLRERYLEPLEQGPLGQMAKRDATTKSAINALFSKEPLANSQQEITTAVTALNQRNPRAAQQLVRTYVEGVFNQATRDLQPGPNQWGGATFRAALAGNPQMERNLQAAVTALHGPEAWQGFNRFLDLAEATGRRMRVGSQTSFNTEALDALKAGTPLQQIPNIAFTGGLKIPSRVQNWLERVRLGTNLDEVASLLTDPAAAGRFRALLLAPPTSPIAARNMIALGVLGARSARNADEERTP